MRTVATEVLMQRGVVESVGTGTGGSRVTLGVHVVRGELVVAKKVLMNAHEATSLEVKAAKQATVREVKEAKQAASQEVKEVKAELMVLAMSQAESKQEMKET
jgi:hypothetical protein